MATEKHGRIIYGLGFAALAALVIAYLFFEQLIADTFPEAQVTATEAVVTGAELPFDPLVTVVPEEERFLKTPKALDTDPARGDLDSPSVTIIEFGDFQCEGCAEMKPVLEEIVNLYPDDVQHVWKDFPLPSEHPQTEAAALAARCAQQQDTFWAYHDLLFDRQGEFALYPWTTFAESVLLDIDQFESCLSVATVEQRVVEGYLVARSLELDTTPTYYINERKLVGVQDVETLKVIIEEEIAARK